MLRKEYHEKYILKKEKIKDIEEETKNIFILFEELKEEIEYQEEKVNIIAENIHNINEKVVSSENKLKEAKSNSKVLNYTTTLFGAGLGSLMVLYNPYLCIGSIIIGGMFGHYSGNYLNKNN